DVPARRIPVELVALVEIHQAGQVRTCGATHRMRWSTGWHGIVTDAEDHACRPAYAGLRQCRHCRGHDVLATEKHLDARHDELARERSGYCRITDRERRIPAMGLASLAEHANEPPADEGPREARAGTVETEPVENAEDVGVVPDVRGEQRAQRRFVG